MPRKNRPSRPVIACEFDALTFRQATDMKMIGPFMSARQHPQWWICNVRCHTLVEGKEQVINHTICPDQPVMVGFLARWIKDAVRDLGVNAAYSIRVYARVVDKVSVMRKLGEFRGIPLEDDEVIHA